jgi:antitoxin (DNA-binding transcriptional repressor) of toxin-antitoxin stability system
MRRRTSRDLLRRVRAGEEIVIAAAGRPVARLVPIAPDSGPRVLGGDEGEVWIAEDFNAPLPDAVVAAFYGAGPNEALARVRSRRRVRSRTRTSGRR